MRASLPILSRSAAVALLAFGLPACGNESLQQPFFPEPDVTEDVTPDALPDADEVGNDISSDAPDGSDAPDVEVDTGPDIPTYDQTPTWVEVAIAPRRAIYAPGVAVTLTATVYGPEGAPMPEVEVVWRASPDGSATLDDAATGRFTITGEGEVTFIACVRYPEVPSRPPCGGRTVFSDAASPSVVITRPLPGQMLSAVDDARIRVAGVVTDTNANLEVFVNGDRVVVGRDGQFTASLLPSFGINHIDVVASDGVQTREGRAALDVLYANDYVPMAPTSGGDGSVVAIPDALSLALRQRFLDDGTPLVLTPETVSVETRDLVGILELVLSQTELMTVIPDPVVNSTDIQLRVTDAVLGRSTVTAAVTETGLEFFVSLPAIRVETLGELRIGDVALDLDGGFEASVAVAIALRVVKPTADAALDVQLQSVRLALEDARGFFVSEEANAVLEVVEGLLFRNVEALVVNAVEDAFVAEVPGLLEGAIGSIEDLLRDQRFPIDIGFGDPVELLLDGQLATVLPLENQRLTASLDLSLGHSGESAFPSGRGVPINEPIDQEALPFSGTDIAINVRLPVLNGLLYAIWNTGFIDLDVSEQLPAEFAFLIDSVRIKALLPPVITPPGPDRLDWDLVLSIGQLEATLGRGAQQDVYGVTLTTGIRVRVVDDVLGVELEDVPTVFVWLIEQGGPRALFEDPNALGAILQTVVWSELSGTLAEGVSVPLPSIDFDFAADIAPALNDLALRVRLDRPPTVIGGHVYVYGGLSATATIGEAPVEPEGSDEPE